MPKLSMRFSAQEEGSEAEDGRNPDADEETLFSAPGEPEVDGKEERRRGSHNETNLCHMNSFHFFSFQCGI